MTSSPVPEPVRDLVAEARRITVLTGAGMSAESGVPTFRDAQTGLWARHDPQTLATPRAWEDDPALVWAWYQGARGGALCRAPRRASRAR